MILTNSWPPNEFVARGGNLRTGAAEQQLQHDIKKINPVCIRIEIKDALLRRSRATSKFIPKIKTGPLLPKLYIGCQSEPR